MRKRYSRRASTAATLMSSEFALYKDSSDEDSDNEEGHNKNQSLEKKELEKEASLSNAENRRRRRSSLMGIVSSTLADLNESNPLDELETFAEPPGSLSVVAEEEVEGTFNNDATKVDRLFPNSPASVTSNASESERTVDTATFEQLMKIMHQGQNEQVETETKAIVEDKTQELEHQFQVENHIGMTKNSTQNGYPSTPQAEKTVEFDDACPQTISSLQSPSLSCEYNSLEQKESLSTNTVEFETLQNLLSSCINECQVEHQEQMLDGVEQSNDMEQNESYHQDTNLSRTVDSITFENLLEMENQQFENNVKNIEHSNGEALNLVMKSNCSVAHEIEDIPNSSNNMLQEKEIEHSEVDVCTKHQENKEYEESTLEDTEDIIRTVDLCSLKDLIARESDNESNAEISSPFSHARASLNWSLSESFEESDKKTTIEEETVEKKEDALIVSESEDNESENAMDETNQLSRRDSIESTMDLTETISSSIITSAFNQNYVDESYKTMSIPQNKPEVQTGQRQSLERVLSCAYSLSPSRFEHNSEEEINEKFNTQEKHAPANRPSIAPPRLSLLIRDDENDSIMEDKQVEKEEIDQTPRHDQSIVKKRRISEASSHWETPVHTVDIASLKELADNYGDLGSSPDSPKTERFRVHDKSLFENSPSDDTMEITKNYGHIVRRTSTLEPKRDININTPSSNHRLSVDWDLTSDQDDSMELTNEYAIVSQPSRMSEESVAMNKYENDLSAVKEESMLQDQDGNLSCVEEKSFNDKYNESQQDFSVHLDDSVLDGQPTTQNHSGNERSMHDFSLIHITESLSDLSELTPSKVISFSFFLFK